MSKLQEQTITALHNHVRHLEWRAKQNNKVMGRQGQTIHELRCEIAELRLLISKADRGALRVYEDTVAENVELHQRVGELQEKLAAHEVTA